MNTIATILKSLIKKIPPMRNLIAEQDALRAKVNLLEQGLLQQPVDPTLINEKLSLIDFAFNIRKPHSVADLGAIGLVHGGYTFYILEKYNLKHVLLVDTRSTNEMLEASKKFPQAKIIRGNFGSEEIAQQVGQVDMIFLFDVLLHQVNPNWDEILELYAPQTQCFLVFTPQWIRSDSTTRLLELGEDEYYQNIPHGKEEGNYKNLFQKLDEVNPNYDRKWRDIHHIWQWGITDIDLIKKMNSLGFRMQYFRNYGQFEMLKNFENHAFVFSKHSLT